MKKLIAWFLVLAMCVSMFAACGQEATPTTLPTEGPTQATEAPEAVDLGDPEALASVLEYLTTIYKNAGGLSPKDFTRVGTVPFGTTKYEVVWTASVGSDLVNIIKNDDGMVTIDVNELCEVETPYTLTATITDAAGNSVSHSWEHILPAAMNVADILDEAYALESGASLPYEVTLTGVVVSVDDLWSEQYGNITVTIAMEGHEDRPVKCYRLSGDGAKELAVGDTITVTGTITNYKGIIEFAQGCTLDSRISGGGVSPSNREYKYIGPLNDGDRVVIYNISYMKALSCKKTGYYNVGVNVSRDAEGNLTGFGTTEVWTVRKHGKSYSFIDANGEKLALGDQYTSLSSDGSNDDWMFVRRNSTRYALQNTKRTELFLQWASTYGNFSTRSVIDPETNKEYVIGIYILAEDEVVEDAPSNDPAADTELSIKEAIDLGASKDHNTYTDNKYYVTGVITEVYNTTYGNMKITDENGNILTIYGTYDADGTNRYDAMDVKPVAGDTVTVYGIIGQYRDVAQMKNGWIVEHIPAGGSTDDDTTEDDTTDDDTVTMVPTVVDTPAANTAYKFGMVQGNCDNKIYYLAGGMSGYYMATTEDYDAAIDVYLEETTDGYYFYTLVEDGTKLYINMVVSGTYVNGAYEATASTVYTYDAENKTVIAVVNDAEYWHGTRNDKTYTTMGPCKVEYEGFFGQFYIEVPAEDDTTGGETTEPVTLTSIAVSTNPTKTEYTVGDTFDAAGLVVTATYSDGTTATVSESEYTLSTPDMTTAGTKTVTVTYEGKEATFEITVAVKTPGYQKVTSADELTTGKYVLVTDKGYAPKVLDGTWISAGKPTVNSDGTITVSNAEGYVWDLTVSGSSVTLTDPDGNAIAPKSGNTNGIQKGSYNWDWSFADGKFVFAGTGSDTTRLASNHSSSYKFRAYKTVTLDGNNASGYSYKFTLYKLVDDIGGSGSTTEATVTSIAVTTAPTKTEYTVGETFDPAGLVVTATYSNGNTNTLEETEYILSAPDMTTDGTKTVKVSYTEDITTTFQITVNKKDEEPEETEPVLKDGDQVVIWAPAYNKALSSELVSATSFYQKGVDVTETDGVLTGFGETEIWTVSVNDDGTYCFAYDGENIGMGDSYASMSLGGVNDDWQVVDLGDGLYNIKNVVRGNYIDWYASKSNWSTYNTSSAATNKACQLAFYVIPSETTVTVSIADYAAANSWVSGTAYDTINMDDVVTVTATGTPTGSYGLNTGKYYTNGNNWRIYQNESATLTISADGKTIVSVKVTYTISNTGVLTLNGENIASDTVVEVNASSVTFSVGNTGTASNGQVRITAIEVVYG